MADVTLQSCPLPPVSPLRWRARVKALQQFNTGAEMLREAGGPVTLVRLGPRRITPTFVMVTSPQGARDVLGGTDEAIDKEMIVHIQSRLFGSNVFNMPYLSWKPRRRTLQPLFTKKHVATFSGHMSEAAEALAAKWAAGMEVRPRRRDPRAHVARHRTFGVWGRLRRERRDRARNRDRAQLCDEAVAACRPCAGRAPDAAAGSLPRGLATLHSVIDEAVAACRTEPDREAELIRLLLDARDPETGRPLTDKAIRDELLVFLLAGHDTTSTTLTYALWALGHHPEMQARVAAEASAAAADRTLSVETCRCCRTRPRWCTKRCGCALLHPRSGGWPCATWSSTGSASRPAPICSSASMPCTATRRCGTIRLASNRTGSTHNSPARAIAGSSCPSAPGPARASAITSRCSKRSSAWPALVRAIEVIVVQRRLPTGASLHHDRRSADPGPRHRSVDLRGTGRDPRACGGGVAAGTSQVCWTHRATHGRTSSRTPGTGFPHTSQMP